MRAIITHPRTGLGMTAAVLVWLCCLSRLAAADDARLVIRQMSGHSAYYALNEIEDLTYGADELYVATTAGTYVYALSEIDRIDFLLGTIAGIDDSGGQPISVDP
jgi:hypothetical protein